MDKKMIAKELMKVASLLAADTFKCPDCGSKVLDQTKYCVKCKKKVKKAGVDCIAAGDKRYNTMTSVGKAKYVVNFHDGVSTHRDGSEFYDIALFSNKKAFNRFVHDLETQGYREAKHPMYE